MIRSSNRRTCCPAGSGRASESSSTKTASWAALWALDHGFVHVVASDAHGTRARTADLQEVFQWIAGHYSPEYASLLLEENPRHILQDTLFRPA